MPRWVPECPFCGSKLDIAKVKYGISFPCIYCGKVLHISGFYFWMPALAGFFVAGLLGYKLGFRFPKILVFPVLFGFPLAIWFGLLLMSAFRPKIDEHYPDYRDLKRRF